MDYGRLSSRFWRDVDRDSILASTEVSRSLLEDEPRTCISEWNQIVTHFVDFAQEYSKTQEIAALLHQFRQLVRKNLDSEVLQSQIDYTAASSLIILADIKDGRVLQRSDRSALRKFFLSNEATDSFSQAAVGLIREFGQLLPESEFLFLKTLGSAQDSTASGASQIAAEVEKSLTKSAHAALLHLPCTSTDIYGVNVSNKAVDSLKAAFAVSLPKPQEHQPSLSSSKSSITSAEKHYSTEVQNDVVRTLFKSQFVDEQGISTAFDDIIPVVRSLLLSDKLEEAMQNELFEILGFHNFDLISSLLANRTAFRRQAEKGIQEPVKKATRGPAFVPQVTVNITSQGQSKKIGSQINGSKGNHTLGQENFDEDYAAQLQMREIQMLQMETYSSSEKVRYPNVFDSMAEAKESAAFIQGHKLRLPDHESRSTQLYEEISVPAPSKKTIPSMPPLININACDEVINVLFQGYKTLNIIQSMVYRTAYMSNENMLICAPTGAGKTNIAMLAIGRAICQNLLPDGTVDKNLKIIYVAPMKALASEMVRTFTDRLKHYKLRVEEVTGDTQVGKFDLEKTQMIITTPEKWDVITRKSVGDTKLVSQVSLLIIDEIHLLNDERGPVIESLVARTIHMIEEQQKMVRFVGLSATLPNYVDVANFLQVNKEKGLFFFDGRFRPVPLDQTFIGMKQPPGNMRIEQAMYEVLYEKLMGHVRKGFQALVFVHARNQTHRVANTIREMAIEHGDLDLFRPNENEEDYDNRNRVSSIVVKQLQNFADKTQNRELKVLLPDGLGIHHAGMIRSDRNIVERMFKDGGIRVMVCTATLAWGVNLPAHAVIIFGTKVYKAEKGQFEDLDVLDVQQIFGRAGRPQFDTSGHGIIITTHESMPKFLKMMVSSQDIESQLPNHLLEHLNAEIVLHNISTVDDAYQWLRSTYWYQRVPKNPLAYGYDRKKAQGDPAGYMRKWFEEKVHFAGRELDKAKLVRYDEKNKFFHPTQFGNIASWYYIDVKTMQVFSDSDNGLREMMQEYEILSLVCKASEFSQIKVRNEELSELDEWKEGCPLPRAEGVDDSEGKVSVLIQSYISRCQPQTHSLSSDLYYCQQNAARILRAVFQMAMYKNWSNLADKALNLCLFVENRLWLWDHPLKQLGIELPESVFQYLEQKNLKIDRLKELDEIEIAKLVRNRSAATKIKQYCDQYPTLDVEAIAKPIGNAVIQINLRIEPKFYWNDKFIGSKRSMNFWVWADDPNNGITFHTQEYCLQKAKVVKKEMDDLEFVIPASGAQEIMIHIRSDRFLHSFNTVPIYLNALKMPKQISLRTELLNLTPLPIEALQDAQLISLYKFPHFNPIQTQVFHTLMHTDLNVLLGAPTGSGKTIAAELAIFRALKVTRCKVVYIAPLKALVRERMADWKERLEGRMGWKVVELTGDSAPDMRAVNAAQIIIATPEKWDGISRSWQNRSYVQDVKLLIFDEIHMLGEDRGPVIEVIVSRTNFIASFTRDKVRIVGLSTALASADDVAMWLGIRPAGLFNFSSAVRPVPLIQHISGYPGKHYCPRMALMNKPTFQAIRSHSAGKPVLVFVSSRRQTRLTGMALLSFASMDLERDREWLIMNDSELMEVTAVLKDNDLKQLVMYGIGIHHAGLHEKDRTIVEHLFLNGKILVLIATATLAWGVNFPAHLVVIKGTEFYDGKTKQYVKYPLTDVLQMAGRAGRPQFDKDGVAVILCHEPLKNYYMKFMHNPLPVESQLQDVLADHLNAEIVAGTLTTLEGTLEYMTWTYYYRRLLGNPDYYLVHRPSAESNPEKAKTVSEDDPVLVKDVRNHVEKLVLACLEDLKASNCIEFYLSEEKKKVSLFTATEQKTKNPNFLVIPTYLGTIASYYYLKHGTMRLLDQRLTSSVQLSELLVLLSDVQEFDQMPVRHNEDAENGLLSKQLPITVEISRLDSPHAKVLLLLQVYFSRNQVPMPNTDYATDLKTVMDQVMRVLQGMIDVSAQKGYLATTLRIMQLSQMMVQGEWIGSDPFLTLPFTDSLVIQALKKFAKTLPELAIFASNRQNLIRMERALFEVVPSQSGASVTPKILEAINTLPLIRVSLSLKKCAENTDDVSLDRDLSVGNQHSWTAVEAGATYTLEVAFERVAQRKMPGKRVATTRFAKPKDENWWIILGDTETGELIAMKRFGFINRSLSTSLEFAVPKKTGRFIFHFYLISDSYFGFDQQVKLYLEAPLPLEL